MAVFKSKDREKRRSRKAYHASAMARARESVYYADPELSREEWEKDAWDDYVLYMHGNQADPVSHEKFLKELRK